MPTVSNDSPLIYLIEDDAMLATACQQALMLAGTRTQHFTNAEAAFAACESAPLPQAVITDLRLPGKDGMWLLQSLQNAYPDLPIILITGHGDVTTAVEAMRSGAFDFIEKPFHSALLVAQAQKAIAQQALLSAHRQLQARVAEQTSPIAGDSPAIAQVRTLISQLATAPIDILIWGETGTGKELVAQELHRQSGRKGAFVSINCAAIPDSIFESEMFGNEAGAFTGAQKRRIGKLEHAHQGTLFLDEIESMPLAQQAKLLRVLQMHELERLGSNQAVQIDLRVVAATKTDLKLAADQGQFRADLYYRLNVATIRLPALRDRKNDISLLATQFVKEAANRFGKPAPTISGQQYETWEAHDWPGNVRELKHAAERFCLGLASAPMQTHQADYAASQSLPEQVAQFEKSRIIDSLKAANGQVTEAAQALQIPRKTFYDKLAKYQIDPDTFR